MDPLNLLFERSRSWMLLRPHNWLRILPVKLFPPEKKSMGVFVLGELRNVSRQSVVSQIKYRDIR